MFKDFLSEKGISVGFILPIILLIVSIVWVGYSVVWKNINAKDVVFSYSALVAAFVMFALNCFFSLQSNHEVKVITSSMEKNKISKEIKINERDFSYANVKIQEWNLYENSEDAEKLEATLKALTIGVIINKLPDWEHEKEEFKDHSISSHAINKNNRENTYYSIDDVIGILKLEKSKDDIKCFHDGIYTPPKTKLTCIGSGMMFNNRYLTIKININISPLRLPEDNFKKEIIDYNITLKTTYNGEYSHNINLKKYKKWVGDIHSALHHELSTS